MEGGADGVTEPDRVRWERGAGTRSLAEVAATRARTGGGVRLAGWES